MALGFEFHETMSGTYHLLEAPGDELPMSITVRAEVHGLRRFALDPTAEITGEVDARGYADHRALRGTLEINPFVRRRLVYDFHFDENTGRRCRFHGEKELEPTRIVSTMTTLPGTIYCEDREIGRALLRFHLRTDLLRMLRSFRRR